MENGLNIADIIDYSFGRSYHRIAHYPISPWPSWYLAILVLTGHMDTQNEYDFFLASLLARMGYMTQFSTIIYDCKWYRLLLGGVLKGSGCARLLSSPADWSVDRAVSQFGPRK